MEAESEHPLARAIVTAASGRPAVLGTDIHSRSGEGVDAVVEGRHYTIGGPTMLKNQSIVIPERFVSSAKEWSARGATVLSLVSNGQVLAAFALEDEVRPQSAVAVAELRSLGISHIALVTGDAHSVARHVGREIGIDEVFAEVMPADKDRSVSRLQEQGRIVAMVGDGVNDAPALARADVGIAIGAGTDVAIESAGVVLAGSDPRAVGAVIRLSRATYRKMRQNLFWAAGYNVLAIPIAAGMFRFMGLSMPPALGAGLMSVSTLVVAANAQLLRRLELSSRDMP